MNKNKIFKCKSPLFVITIVVTTLLLIVFGFWIAGRVIIHPEKTFETTQSVSVPTTKGEVKYQQIGDLKYIWKENDGQISNKFKIMTTTDLHIMENDADFTLNVLSNLIDREKPDLVVLVGDNIFDVQDPTNVNKLISLFEQKNQYWTFVLGNHDGQGWENKIGYDASRKKAFDVLSGKEWDKKPTYCIATSEGDTSKVGWGTNCINIGKPDNIFQSLYFFDCMTIFSKVNNDVINWYKQKAQDVKAANKGIMPQSIAFNHIPFMEMDTAYKNVGKDQDVSYHFGNLEEEIDYGNSKNGLFEAFKENNTKTIVFGHDHVNNLCISYQDVKMIFSLGLAYNCYTRRNNSSQSWFNNVCYGLDDYLCDYIDGATDYVIEKDKNVQITNVYNQFNGIFNGLENQLWKHSNYFFTYNTFGLNVTLRVLMPIISLGSITYFVLFIRNNKAHKNTQNKK